MINFFPRRRTPEQSPAEKYKEDYLRHIAERPRSKKNKEEAARRESPQRHESSKDKEIRIYRVLKNTNAFEPLLKALAGEPETKKTFKPHLKKELTLTIFDTKQLPLNREIRQEEYFLDDLYSDLRKIVRPFDKERRLAIGSSVKRFGGGANQFLAFPTQDPSFLDEQREIWGFMTREVVVPDAPKGYQKRSDGLLIPEARGHVSIGKFNNDRGLKSPGNNDVLSMQSHVNGHIERSEIENSFHIPEHIVCLGIVIDFNSKIE